ncbi:MAG TPA: TIR domain-containing protein [Chthoniobacterales bacterium]|nr:TIR domain-containing protein [Chthoniobacterales bacterium]
MIAISYRRQDSSPVAGRLYDRLQAEFGKGSVFMDFDSIPYGVDFREHIKQTLQRAKVIVAIIGPEWTGGKELSNRRIDDPTDFVRLEVASALESGIAIIPVLVNNTPMPEAKNLPPELEGLAFRNGLALDTGIDFHHHADRLIAGIHRVVDPPKETPPPVIPPLPAAVSAAQKPSRALPIAIVVLLIAIAGIAAWFFQTRTRPETIVRQETTPAPARAEVSIPPRSETPAPAPSTTNPPPAITSSSPNISSAPGVTSSPAAINETPREHVFIGKVGAKEATFRFRFEPGGHVVGTYSQGGATYRLEGRHPKGKMFLDEYTGEKLTAHIEVSLVVETATLLRWEGTMRNTPPDNRVLPVYFERSVMVTSAASPTPASESSGASGDYSYQGTVGPYEASFQLHFDPSGRVTGTYFLATNRNLVLRLEGRNPKGKLLLDEYTRDRLSARIELKLNDSANDIRWEGTMHNTPPDNRVFPVSFARPRE